MTNIVGLEQITQKELSRDTFNNNFKQTIHKFMTGENQQILHFLSKQSSLQYLLLKNNSILAYIIKFILKYFNGSYFQLQFSIQQYSCFGNLYDVLDNCRQLKDMSTNKQECKQIVLSSFEQFKGIRLALMQAKQLQPHAHYNIQFTIQQRTPKTEVYSKLSLIYCDIEIENKFDKYLLNLQDQMQGKTLNQQYCLLYQIIYPDLNNITVVSDQFNHWSMNMEYNCKQQKEMTEKEIYQQFMNRVYKFNQTNARIQQLQNLQLSPKDKLLIKNQKQLGIKDEIIIQNLLKQYGLVDVQPQNQFQWFDEEDNKITKQEKIEESEEEDLKLSTQQQ